MDKLIFRILKSNADIELVLEKIENYSGIRLPEVYASNSKIVGVFLHDQLAACYMLVTKPAFRSLIFVPDSIKRNDGFFSTDDFEMMEVNGLWIGPALKKPRQQLRVWMHLIKDIFMCRKKFVLLMRDVRNRNMERFMNMANPHILYEGAPQLMADDITHSKIQVSYTTRWKIVLNVHKYLAELIQRQRRAAAYTRQRELVRVLKQSDPEFS